MNRLFCLVWIFLPCDNVPEAELNDCGSVPSAEELLSLFCYSSRESAIIIYPVYTDQYFYIGFLVQYCLWFCLCQYSATGKWELCWLQTMAWDNDSWEGLWILGQWLCLLVYKLWLCFQFWFKKPLNFVDQLCKKKFPKFVLKIDKTTILINSIVLHHIIV